MPLLSLVINNAFLLNKRISFLQTNKSFWPQTFELQCMYLACQHWSVSCIMCAVASCSVPNTAAYASLGSGTEPEKLGEMFCVFMGSGAVSQWTPWGKENTTASVNKTYTVGMREVRWGTETRMKNAIDRDRDGMQRLLSLSLSLLWCEPGNNEWWDPLRQDDPQILIFYSMVIQMSELLVKKIYILNFSMH